MKDIKENVMNLLPKHKISASNLHANALWVTVGVISVARTDISRTTMLSSVCAILALPSAQNGSISLNYRLKLKMIDKGFYSK